MSGYKRNSLLHYEPPLQYSLRLGLRHPSEKDIRFDNAKAFADQNRALLTCDVDPNKIRIRLPEEDTADLESLINRKHENIRKATCQAGYFSRPPQVGQLDQMSLRRIANLITEEQYKEAKMVCDRLILTHKHSAIAAFYAYIASLLERDFDLETDALKTLDITAIPDEDHAHFYHLIDELPAMSDLPFATLLNMAVGVSDFKLKEPNAIPIISSTSRKNYREFYNKDENGMLQNHRNLLSLQSLRDAVERNSKNIPELKVVSEPIKTKTCPPPKDVSAVGTLIANGKITEAIDLASAGIAKGVDVGNMYLLRAIALIKLLMFPQALSDITNSIDIESSDEKLRIRAALWLLAGQNKLANHDLERVKEKTDIADIIRSLSGIC